MMLHFEVEDPNNTSKAWVELIRFKHVLDWQVDQPTWTKFHYTSLTEDMTEGNKSLQIEQEVKMTSLADHQEAKCTASVSVYGSQTPDNEHSQSICKQVLKWTFKRNFKSMFAGPEMTKVWCVEKVLYMYKETSALISQWLISNLHPETGTGIKINRNQNHRNGALAWHVHDVPTHLFLLYRHVKQEALVCADGISVSELSEISWKGLL